MADAADVPNAYLCFEADTEERLDPAEADELARLLREYQIPIAVLNACQSGQQVGDTETSQPLRAGRHADRAGHGVLGHRQRGILDDADAVPEPAAAPEPARGLRRGAGRLHHEKRRRAYFNQEIRLEDWLLPVVYQPQGDVPTTLPLREMSLTEQAALLAGQVDRYQAPEPQYGFVGRDVDILQIEKRVLSTSEGKRRNLLLVQGMGRRQRRWCTTWAGGGRRRGRRGLLLRLRRTSPHARPARRPHRPAAVQPGRAPAWRCRQSLRSSRRCNRRCGRRS